MSRSNDRWLADLAVDAIEQETALRDLREALVRNLRRALSNRPIDDAFIEDAVQDALLRILDRLDRFEGRSRFLTWATAIAIRVAMEELRRRRWQDVSLDEILSEAGLIPESAVDANMAPGGQSERRAMFAALHRAIENELTDKQRTALLAELKGMPQGEIARQLGSNRNAVYKLTHDARKKIRKAMTVAGYTAADVALAD